MQSLKAVSVAALSIVLVGDVAHAGGRTLPSGPVKAGSVQIGPSTQAPPALGWPHDVRSAAGTVCHAAGPSEVVITVVSGACLSLAPGFYTTLNDVSHTWLVSQISVGSAVRARAFWLEHFSQQQDRAFIMYSPGASLPLTGDAQTIRSLRVEPANRSLVCNDLQEGEIALFEGWDGGGDCVVLPVGQYPSADAMGIANDSISGVNNQTGTKAILFFNASFNKQGAVVNPHQRLARLPQGGHFSDTIDNQTSSMQMIP
ncbi:MAG: hypothetical protein ABIP89_22235 [Polyangiaceae bacterium]